MGVFDNSVKYNSVSTNIDGNVVYTFIAILRKVSMQYSSPVSDHLSK